MSSANQRPPSWLFSNNLNPTVTRKNSEPDNSKTESESMAKSGAGKARNTPSAPPAQLMDMVESFLSEHSFSNAHNAFIKHRKTKGWRSKPAQKDALGSLVQVYESWQSSRGELSKPKSPHGSSKKRSKDTAFNATGLRGSRDVDMKDVEDVFKSHAHSEATSSDESEGESANSSSSDEDDSSSSSSDSSSSDKTRGNKKTANMKAMTTFSKKKTAENRPQLKRKAPVESSSAASSSSSGSSSDTSSMASASKRKEPPMKKRRKSSSSSSSESSSESSSDDEGGMDLDKDKASDPSDSTSTSSSSGSDSQAELGLDAQREAAQISLPDSDGDESSNNGGTVIADTAAKASSDSSVTLDKTSPDLQAPTQHKGKKGKVQNTPFSRIPKNIAVNARFASNAYVPVDYSQRAHEDLIVTKGKGFTKEKNKKKRGSFRGGMIDINERKGIYFDDD